MSKMVFKLFEYSKKEIPENAFTRKEIIAVEKMNEGLKKSQKLSADVILFDYQKNKLKFLRTNYYVGVIRAGNKTIQIIPKMARGGSDDEKGHSSQAVRNLLYMLNYTKKLQVKEADLASLCKTNDNFFEILIHLFAKNLLDLIQNNINKEYIENEENLPYVKGKLEFSEHIRVNLINKGRFFLRHDYFCEDNLLNRTFKYTTSLLFRATNSFTNQKLLQQLSFIFSDISPVTIRSSDLKNINLNRLNQQYEPILNLCKIFIGQSSLELSADKIDTFSFIIDMNALFEEFIGMFIKKNFPEYSKIKLQGRDKYFVNEKYVGQEASGKVFQLRPDILLYGEENDPSLIIDTKYKILEETQDKKEGISQADLYQMFAYSKKYNCSDIILLYPRLMGGHVKDIKFEVDEDTNVFVRNVDLCRDLKVNKNELRQELAQILAV